MAGWYDDCVYILRVSTLLYLTLPYSTLLYLTQLYSTLLYSTVPKEK
jgi:hypothetical protein